MTVSDDVFVFPASWSQQRLWFLDQFDPGSPFYNIPSPVRITGPLDAGALERTLNEIVRRHEVLRTTFATVDGKPVQVIAPEATVPLPVTDLRHLPAHEREAEALRLATEDARRPFNLSAGPLIRAALIRLDECDHVVLLTTHHIVSDGWSQGVLVGEIAAIYDAFSRGKPSPLPELPIQYADYSEWQREYLSGPVLEEQLAYWRRQLGGDLPVLKLPTDRPRPAVQSSRGSSLRVEIPGDVLDPLRALCRQEGATLFMTLLAAFQVLLARYTGQRDITVGTPVANRTRPEVEGLIGCFINTLVLRARLEGNPPFREFLAQVKETSLGAFAHQDVPFEMLVDALQPDRAMSYSPLFQVMFILQNAPVNVRELPGLTLRRIEAGMGTSTFDLTLSIAEGPHALDVSVEYSTDLFEASTIRRMLGHFQTLLAAIGRSPATGVFDLPLLGEEERARILCDWSGTEKAYPSGCDVHQLIEQWAERTPDAVAVVAGGERLTYAELNARAGEIARRLDASGAGVLVPVEMERSGELIATILGVLKSGRAYLPIDPNYPEERRAFMRRDSAGFTGAFGDLAYVIYTSGSTGQSKGVMVSRRSWLNAYRAWEDSYRLAETTAHLQMASFSFDVFAGDFVRALCSGKTLVICPREYLLDPPRLYALMRCEGVDCAEFVPAVLRALAEYLLETGQTLGFMRLLICGSDSWYAGEYEKFRRLCGPATRLINSFGLTEATIDSSFFEAGELPGSPDLPVPIGRPFANTRLYILDSRLRPAPAGVPGELVVGGEGVARGYLNRPELNAERFIPDPFSGKPGARLYRTGDLARFLPDGNIELIGRADYQLKIRGFRVEPGEIEAVLGRHPEVRQAVVLARTHQSGEQRLVAYLVAGEARPSPGELRRFLLDRLPEYMVPSAFVFLGELPLTPNGKIDRQALPAPEWSRRDSGREYIAPRSPVEGVLASLWSEVLGVAQVGVCDNFFELGGHSLMAAQVIARIREAFQIDLPLRNIFESPTVAELAERVEAARRASMPAAAPPIRRVPRDGGLPVSFAQQRLWFLDQLEPGSPFYNLPEFYRLTGPLNVAALERALNEVVRRHEALRTTFDTVDGRPVQVVAPELTIPLPVIDAEPAEARRIAAEFARQPFDLKRGPLLRARLLRLGPQEHIVLLVAHHIVSDDWSSRVFMQEIAALYEAFSLGRPSPLPELPVQYPDYAAWQRQWLQGEVLDRELAYWKSRLAGIPPVLNLPVDRPRPAVQTFSGDYEQFTLSAEVTAALKSLTRKERATAFMTLLALFEVLLYRYSGQDDFAIGTPIAGRNRAELEPLIGFFINTLVLRAGLAGDPTFRELLARVRETALDAYAHQEVPFELLVDALQPERDLSHSPLFQTMFVLQNAPVRMRELPGSRLTLSPEEAHSGTAKFDLTLFMVEGGEQFAGALEYNTDLFDRSTIRRMLDHFAALAGAVAANPDQPISALEMLAPSERRQIVEEWNRTEVALPGPQCAHRLFEHQVERTPHALAAICGEERVTFRELDARANRVAAFLKAQGVGPETLVGVLMDRSVDLVASLIGIWKAGGAYVPIDPAYPEQRRRFMLADAGVRLVLTPESLSAMPPDAPHVSLEVSPANLAYVIYTSGSTGAPKGAMITHGGLVNYLEWCRRAYPLDGGRGSVVYSSIAFDLTVTALFAPLVCGRPVLLLSGELSLESLAGALRREGGFSLIKITPAHLELLGRQLTPEEARDATRAFVIGGENLLAEHIAFWQKHAPATALINEYGPTETVVGCCVYTAGAEQRFNAAVPIGAPIINTRLYILDAHWRPVPVGVVGELYIGGAGVARGYLRRPDLTAERFIPDAFSGESGARLYRTGDLARYRPGGNIECLGRADHQVKVRGFRVELGEVEAAMREHPGVREAAAEVREGRLIGYLAATEEGAAGLRAFLSERLPDYMVPSLFVTLDALPLTPNGKVDRRALPAPGAERPDLVGAYAAPRTPVEETLAAIFSALLKIERVGANDSFFDLGGHSLLATQLVSRIRDTFGAELPLRTVFEAPTVAGLAQAIEAAARPSRPPLAPVPRGGRLPLSFAQQRLWFLDQLEPGIPIYNIPAAIRLTGALDLEALERALNALVRRHEALRTTFQEIDGEPVQVIAPEMTVPLPVTEVDSTLEAARLAGEEARRPFDLARGPLFRARVLRLAGDDHVLLVTMHHIVSDGWSTGVLIAEVAALYQSLPLAPLPVQYADYAVWQRRWLAGETLAAQLDYWKRQLAGAPPLDLPTDHARPALPAYRGATEAFTLPPGLFEALERLSRREGATAFMTLVAAFQLLLARYSGQDDISIGTPVANRSTAEVEGLIGFFVNTLVLRTDLSGDPTFAELLKRVRETALGAYANQDVPFEMVVQALEPERDLSRSPLFQVMFVLQNTPMEARELPGLRLAPIEAASGVSAFDLTLSMGRTGGVVEYSTDLFEPATIRRMTGHFTALLEAAVAGPEQRLSALRMLSDAERRQVLEEWNRTRTAGWGDKTVIDIFEAQAEAHPDRTAVVFGEQRLTYRELNERAGRVAAHLQERGAGPDVLVALSLERSVEMIVALLGVMKAGAAYVPLDPNYPPERLAFMLADCRPALVIDRGTLPEYLETPAPAPKPRRACPDNLAYVIYTSGSTGRPKGVMLCHRGLTNLVHEQTIGFQVKPGSRVLQFASFSFDASVSEIFMALTTGAALHLAGQETLMSPPDLVRLMREQAISVVTLPPSLLAVLPADGFPELATLISAGEACSWEIVDRWAPGRRFLNAYGPTECTIGPAFYVAESGTRPSRNVPIGRPIGNTTIYILDPSLEPVPVGVPGELYIGGAGVARGYLGRPDLTAEKFLPDPFSAEPGARLYRTGDLARYLDGGDIEYLGRIDQQVKVRGFRIELGEIENVLREHPAVKDAVAVVRGDRLVAYVIGSSEGLRDHLRQRLPDYMAPAAIVALDAFPLTPNGKVDRKALPAPEVAASPERPYVAPRDAEEEIVAGIWAGVLNAGPVGATDNFFDLGGHSLLATQVVSRVRAAFAVELPLRALFESPTVAGMAAAVRAARQSALPPIPRASRDGELPLSFAQQRLWFLEQLEPGTPLYNLPVAVRLTGRLDVAALEWSLNEIVRRHEILRTSFVSAGGRAAQVIAPQLTLELPVTDLAGEPGSHIREVASREAQRPFDVSRAPLIRARLLRLGDQDHVALLVMHHIVSDGWSMGVLVREIAALYAARLAGRPSPLAELPVQYADFAAWQRQWLAGERLEAQLQYWKRQLAGLPPLLELPTDRPRPKYQGYRGGSAAFTVPQDTARRLEALGRQRGATLFMTLMAAFQALLHRYTSQEEFGVGTPSANRNRAEIEDLIGFFVNTLVLRADLTGDPGFQDLIDRVRRTALEAYAHQDAPFEMVVDAVAPERDMSHTPLFQAMFVFQNTPPLRHELPGLKIEPVEAETGIAKFDLMFSMAGGAAGLSGSIEYNADLFDPSTIARMAGHFRNLLESAVAEPDLPVSKLPMLAPDERRALIEAGAATRVCPVTDCIHERVEAQAARTPDAVAVTFENQSLTYRELNERAGRLASHLAGLGIRPDTLVALYMERSIDLVVAILGILKSGGAYLPIDPVYPPERIAFMLEDSEAPVLITDSTLRDRLPAYRGRILQLDTLPGHTPPSMPHRPSPQNIAYVIYTSGSTGKPKGVPVTHANVVRLFDATCDWYRFGTGDVWTFFHSAAFDFSVWEIWGALFYGGRVVVVPYLVSRSPEAFYDLLERERVTVLNQTPSAFRQLIRAAESAGGTRDLALRYVIFGGEALELQSLRPWFQRYGDRRPQLVNMYGITETTVHVTYRPISLQDVEAGAGSVIGRRIPDLEVYVLDRNLEILPAGVPGELYVGGAGCARGYLKRPELTAERFIPNPFSSQPGARLYKTGDLARCLPGNDIEYLGRIDHQVKIRGFRIELGEIEAVLAQHPAIREAFCLVREDGPESKRLVAYLVPGAGAAPTVVELRAFLQQKLPDYMTPAEFVMLDALPLTPHGKVDRRALPAPGQGRAGLGSEYVAPRTREEEILSAIWTRLLGVEKVGIRDNFFALGGDSILSIQVIAQANQAGLRLTPRQIFEHPTVEALARVAGRGAALEAEQGTVTGPLPLTPVQHWFFEHHPEAPHHFNSSMLIEVGGELDLRVLDEALRKLVIHHDALRMRFDKQRNASIAGPDGVSPLVTVDLSRVGQRRRREAIEAACADLQAGFDLERGPLFRAAWLDLGPGEPGRLLLLFHHLVTDGVSWRIFLEDLQHAWQGMPLPPKTASYRQWAERLAEYAQSQEIREELEYWRSLRAPGLASIPFDNPGGANTYGSTGQVTVSLEAGETKALLQAPSGAQDLLLRALARTMARWRGQPRILIETEGHGREEFGDAIDVSRTIGWFTSIYPLLLDAEQDQTPAPPRHGAGYGLLRYLCADARVRAEMAALPSPEVNFNYLGQFDRGGSAWLLSRDREGAPAQAALSAGDRGVLPFRLASESAGPEQSPQGRRSASLYLVGIVTGERLHLRWLYGKQLHKRRTITRLARWYLDELRAILQGGLRH